MAWLYLLSSILGFRTEVVGLETDFESEVRPFLEKHCVQCHGEEKSKGDIDFTLVVTAADVEQRFDWWESVVERLREGEMPPEDEPQPSEEEKRAIYRWYQEHFVETVEARPGEFRPRRLSAVEYRNALESVLGFDLQVNIMEAEQTLAETSLVLKLLPLDPPGPSGFTNDTSGNPLTPLIWSRYSYIVDSALRVLFSRERRDHLSELVGSIGDDGISIEQARRLVNLFRQRTARRPVKMTDADWLTQPDLAASDVESKLKAELKGLLMSPTFLYRGLLMPKREGMQQAVDDYEMAERLSYFLWGDMPDETLLEAARKGLLGTEAEREVQIRRMIHSDKSRHLAKDFAGQWLALGDMEQASRQIPYVVAMRSQVLDFFHYLFVEDRPLLELIDSKVSFVSPLLAKFYPQDRSQLKRYRKKKGIEMEIVPTQRIQLIHTKERGGVLSMPGILAMNRGPVLRGVWMLERILGEHLPEPPMDVGQVPPNVPGEEKSFRERFEAHRSQATCAVCHDQIDPLGFAMQGYDDRGQYILVRHEAGDDGRMRSFDKKGRWLDTSGVMPNGQTFSSFEELKAILKTSYRREIIQNIVERTLSYALCRKLVLHDRPTVEAMVDRLEASDGTYLDLVRLIVNSLPFCETFVKGEAS